jgi:metal-dependent amidase/aminoacylase/carboxypeptidase family protein
VTEINSRGERVISVGIGTAKSSIAAAIEARRVELVALSHGLHADPEVAWEERRASAMVSAAMSTAGFDSRVGVYELETSVEATFGDGDLCVAICAEYDALPGHGCGHNLIAAAAVGPAIGLAKVAATVGLKVKLLGTPAEERGKGKGTVKLLAAGAWENVAFSLMVHGSTGSDIPAASYASIAVYRFIVTFVGRSAHAAAAPSSSVNAADGGETTNVIPGQAVLYVELRAVQLDVWRDLRIRVLACCEGAAIALGCSWTHEPSEPPYAPLVQDPTLALLWDGNLSTRGRILANGKSVFAGASTNMGNVSQVIPSLHPSIAFLGASCAPHTHEFAEAAVSAAADDAIIDAAITMAWTAFDVAVSDTLRREMLVRKSSRRSGSTRQSFSSDGNPV